MPKKSTLRVPTSSIKESSNFNVIPKPEPDFRVSSRENLDRKILVSPPSHIRSVKNKAAESESGTEQRLKEERVAPSNNEGSAVDAANLERLMKLQ
jgi:hypothetical protein